MRARASVSVNKGRIRKAHQTVVVTDPAPRPAPQAYKTEAGRVVSEHSRKRPNSAEARGVVIGMQPA